MGGDAKPPDMKGDWDDRARKNARYYIATPSFESEEEFRESGERDVGNFFSGLEYLLHADVRALDLGYGIGRMDEFVEGDGVSLAVFQDAGLDLVFSYIVFQHAPREVFTGYLPEIFRVLKPGGSFVFQLPEALDEIPADPPQDDTFNLRFYREAAVKDELVEVGFLWKSCKRFRIGTEMPVDYLRIHAVRP